MTTEEEIFEKWKLRQSKRANSKAKKFVEHPTKETDEALSRIIKMANVSIELAIHESYEAGKQAGTM